MPHRYKVGDKPVMYPLHEFEIEFVKQMIQAENDLILTQEMWNVVSETLEMGRVKFMRRAHVSNYHVSIGYKFDEFNPQIHPMKAKVQVDCIHCRTKVVFSAVQLFVNRKKVVQACGKCYAKFYIFDDDWRKRNSAAQLIAQNRPETIEKHKKNTKNMWIKDGARLRASHLAMVTSQSYRDNMRNVISLKWQNDPDYRDRVSGKGSYKHVGSMNDIVYHSLTELAFLLKCADENVSVRRYNESLQYVHPVSGTNHRYYPDFVVNDDTIVEVKGERWIEMDPHAFSAKMNSLDVFCKNNALKSRLVLTPEVKPWLLAAKKYHENQK